MSTGFYYGAMEMFWNYIEVMVAYHMLKDTELFTLKWLILYYVDFTSVNFLKIPEVYLISTRQVITEPAKHSGFFQRAYPASCQLLTGPGPSIGPRSRGFPTLACELLTSLLAVIRVDMIHCTLQPRNDECT